jgi:hypothetical protein
MQPADEEQANPQNQTKSHTTPQTRNKQKHAPAHTSKHTKKQEGYFLVSKKGRWVFDLISCSMHHRLLGCGAFQFSDAVCGSIPVHCSAMEEYK